MVVDRRPSGKLEEALVHSVVVAVAAQAHAADDALALPPTMLRATDWVNAKGPSNGRPSNVVSKLIRCQLRSRNRPKPVSSGIACSSARATRLKTGLCMRAKLAETESPSACAALPRMAVPANLAASVTRRKKANSTDRRAGSRDNASTGRADSTESKCVWVAVFIDSTFDVV